MKAVILAGGSGDHLFPLSTQARPKQFHVFRHQKTLLQDVYDRTRVYFSASDIYIVTTKSYLGFVKEQLTEIVSRNIFVEPSAKNTAPAIGLVAYYFLSLKMNEPFVVISANHAVSRPEAFEPVLKAAERINKLYDKLVLVGVNPTFPSGTLGYIKIGKALDVVEGLVSFSCKEFIERPGNKRAEKYLASWAYLWNSGYLITTANMIAAIYQKKQVVLHQKLARIKDYRRPSAKEYRDITSLSFDHILQKNVHQSQIAVIPADLGWHDLRNWASLFELLPKDKQGDAMFGDVTAHLTKQSLLWETNAHKKLVVIGVNGLTVVDTPNAVLVMPTDKTVQLGEYLRELGENK